MSLTRTVANAINTLLRPFDIKISRISTSSIAPANPAVTEIPIVTTSYQPVERLTLFAPETWVMMGTRENTKLWIDLGDEGVSLACMKQSFETNETNFVKHFLSEGDSFLDIGANIGWFTSIAANCVGESGSVHCFEPRNTTFQYLKKTIESNQWEHRVFAHHCALGAEPGQLRIVWGTQTSNPGGTWLVSRKEVSDMLPTTTHSYQDITVKRLDDFEEIHRIDLIKIDVEGAEPLVLKGAERLLRKFKPVVVSEINEELLKIVGNSSSLELVDWMQTIGYQCFELTDQGIGAQLGDKTISFPSIVNVLFVPIGFDRTKLTI